MFLFQLYEDYADKFDLSECKLAIVHCAGLYDSALIENLWQNIIDKGNFLDYEILSRFRNFYLTHVFLPRLSSAGLSFVVGTGFTQARKVLEFRGLS